MGARWFSNLWSVWLCECEQRNQRYPAHGSRISSSEWPARDGQSGGNRPWNDSGLGGAPLQCLVKPTWTFREYPLGRYMEDNAYLGDLGFVQGVDFDLDEYNGRYCVTPEFPNGTYAYFVSIASNGAPLFPYNIGRAFFGTPTGASVTALTESVATNFVGGPGATPKLQRPNIDRSAGTVTLVWNSVEGGAYQVESSAALGAWSTNTTGVTSQGVIAEYSMNDTGGAHFFRVLRTALATFDAVTNASAGATGGIQSIVPNSGMRGGSVTATITLAANAQPGVPPQNAPILSVTLGSITATSLSRPTQYTIQATFALGSNATVGPQTVTVVFPGPPNNPTASVTYTLAGGFTIH